MSQLLIELSDELLAKALVESQEQQIELNMFIHEALLHYLGEENLPKRVSIGIETIIANAVTKVKDFQVGDEFMLHDICTETDWNSLGSGERKKLGRIFRKTVEDNAPPIANWIRRTSGNKAVYKKL